MTFKPLETSILRTVAYFDLLDYPLTSTEIWKHLYHPDLSAEQRTLADVVAALKDSAALAGHLILVDGFYCLAGRQALIPWRQERNKRADYQMMKARRLVTILRFFPSFRMIAVASSLPLGNVKKDSDIDLFIIAKKDQIWWTRFLAVGLLKFLSQRPTARTRSGRFCLSFFITEDALDISSAALGADDIAYYYYVQSFMPLYDPDGLYDRFLEANAWIQRYLPQAAIGSSSTMEVSRPAWLDPWHGFFESLTGLISTGFLSDWYCRLQLSVLPDNLKSLANVDSRVIISDQILKFHDKDNRASLRRRWQERIKQYV